MRRLLGMLLVALALPALMMPEAAQALTRQQVYARTAVGATNHVRVNHALHALAKQDCLQYYAWRQARRMARQRAMFHQDLGPIMRNCHLRMAAENIAYGYSTGGATVNAWMHSPGHRENILTPGYRGIGLGAVKGSNGLWYVSQVFGRHL